MLGKATGEAGGEEGLLHATQGRQGRSRLDELTFDTFNFRTAAVNGVNGIGHIDTVLKPCAAEGCDVIGLQETKRDGTSTIVASGCRVYFSGDCSGAKGRKGQYGVGLAIEEEIVKKAGKDDIAIECISARLLKARISINRPRKRRRSRRPNTWQPSTAPSHQCPL